MVHTEREDILQVRNLKDVELRKEIARLNEELAQLYAVIDRQDELLIGRQDSITALQAEVEGQASAIAGQLALATSNQAAHALEISLLSSEILSQRELFAADIRYLKEYTRSIIRDMLFASVVGERPDLSPGSPYPSLESRQDAERYLSRLDLIDTEWYLSANPDVRSEGVEPLQHYALFGVWEKRSPNGRLADDVV